MILPSASHHRQNPLELKGSWVINNETKSYICLEEVGILQKLRFHAINVNSYTVISVV